jgi:hypothetical protein
MDTKVWIVERFDEDSSEHNIIGVYSSYELAVEHILRDIGREFTDYMKKYPSHFAGHMNNIVAFRNMDASGVKWGDVEYYYRNIILRNIMIDNVFFFEGYGYSIDKYVLDKVHI